MSKKLSLKITPADSNYEAETREFENKQSAQVRIDEMYLSKYITRDEWSRLFDEISNFGISASDRSKMDQELQTA